MYPFSYQSARSEQDAIAAAIAGGRYLAGGTTLIDLMREEVERPARLIDINQLALRDIRLDGDRLVLGALARMADVAAHAATRQAQPLIVEALHPLQAAFIEQDAFQCGYCTSGQILSGVACIAEGHAGPPDQIRAWMSGNICRCGAYPGIVAAIAETARGS
jgi:xanthine dehydrogenase YagT iron-sulfur-binding subunit